jgi:molybdopterin-guanine dinucleotide biosynthesis protein A
MGSAKAWLSFGDETLLQRVVRSVGEVVSPVVVVAAPGQELPPLPAGVMVARDARSGRGPLEGILAGLLALRGQVDAAFVSSCDAPLLRPGLVRRVVELLGEHLAAAPRIDGRWQPLTAAYRLDLIPRVEEMLAHDRLRVRDLLDNCGARGVEQAELADVDPALDSLRCCNTPEEYARIRALLTSGA